MKEDWKDEYLELLDDYYDLSMKHIKVLNELIKENKPQKTDEELAEEWIKEANPTWKTYGTLVSAFVAGRQSKGHN
jgi:predicted transcriptional regulator